VVMRWRRGRGADEIEADMGGGHHNVERGTGICHQSAEKHSGLSNMTGRTCEQFGVDDRASHGWVCSSAGGYV